MDVTEIDDLQENNPAEDLNEEIMDFEEEQLEDLVDLSEGNDVANDATDSEEEILEDLVDLSEEEDITSEVADFENETLENLVDLSNEETYEEIEEQKVYKRQLDASALESRAEDMAETLDNYRANLEDYGVDKEKINEFVEGEREKMECYYANLDNGEASKDIYYQPTDWKSLADELKVDDMEETSDIMRDVLEQNVSAQKIPSSLRVEWENP